MVKSKVLNVLSEGQRKEVRIIVSEELGKVVAKRLNTSEMLRLILKNRAYKAAKSIQKRY